MLGGLMKKFVFAIACFCFAFFAACGDDFSSGSDELLSRDILKAPKVYPSLKDAKKERCSMLNECNLALVEDSVSGDLDTIQCFRGLWYSKAVVDLNGFCVDYESSVNDTVKEWYSCEVDIAGVLGTHTCTEMPASQADSLKRYCDGMNGIAYISGSSGTQCPGGYVSGGKDPDEDAFHYSYSTKSSSTASRCLVTLKNDETRCYTGTNATLLCNGLNPTFVSTESVFNCPEDYTAECSDASDNGKIYLYAEDADCNSI